MNLHQAIAETLHLPLSSITQTIDLLESGNTVPFIARYRKEVTGNLDEKQILDIQENLHRLKTLEERRQAVLQGIEKQGSLADPLRQAILAATTLTELEDLYAPYRPRRRTRASDAKEKGLEPLASLILAQIKTEQRLNSLVTPFLTKAVPDLESALAGARDIVAEAISENASVRQMVRERGLNRGRLTSERISKSVDERGTYQTYYQFEMPIRLLKPHQILAINRGEKEKILRVDISLEENDWWAAVRAAFIFDHRSPFFEQLNLAAADGAKRLLLPVIQRDLRRSLTEQAESHAIRLFAENLRALLTQPPLADQVILAIDPGFRTGSKFAALDPLGKALETGTIYPHPPQNQTLEARKTVEALVEKYQVTLIVIGNGTASRETEHFVAEITRQQSGLNYLITSEAGASVYSASQLARKEFPDLDVSIRGAISIGRRVQDPLAELVKIAPQSIGVGLYQHDVDQSQLSRALDQVVESVVNAVGVEVNTASATLLTHVAGIGPRLAEKIVQYREEHGAFPTREAIREVPGLGPKTYEQSAGFLRIRDGENPLDATAIHPETYPIAGRILEHLTLPAQTNSSQRVKAVAAFRSQSDLNALAKSLQTGMPTLNDVLDELARPGRDPRENLPKPLLRKDILNMNDLAPGMILKGTIRNVVDFGAFVDIGVKVDGLLHRSKIPRGTPLQVGDIIDAHILSVDHDRQRIALAVKESDPS